MRQETYWANAGIIPEKPLKLKAIRELEHPLVKIKEKKTDQQNCEFYDVSGEEIANFAM